MDNSTWHDIYSSHHSRRESEDELSPQNAAKFQDKKFNINEKSLVEFSK